MLHYVFWFLLVVCSVLVHFGVPWGFFAFMLVVSGATGIAALVQEARHPTPESTGTAAAVSLAQLACLALLALILLVPSGTLATIFSGAIAILVGVALCELFCRLFRSPSLLTVLLAFMLLGNGGCDCDVS